MKLLAALLLVFVMCFAIGIIVATVGDRYKIPHGYRLALGAVLGGIGGWFTLDLMKLLWP